MDCLQGIFPGRRKYSSWAILFNSSFPSALCCDGMIANPGVTCGFGPRALFSSPVLHRQGKRHTQQNPVSPVWCTLALEKHLQFPWGYPADPNLPLAGSLQKHLGGGGIPGRCLQPLLVTLVREQHKQDFGKEHVWGCALFCGILFHIPNVT